MALLMTHLLVARRWAEEHPEYLDCPEFYLGVISPDAIAVRDGDDKSRKNEIHLNNWISPHPDDVAAYWRERSAPFDIGYGIHVLTDGQWVVSRETKLRGLYLPSGELDVDTYYSDAFATDYALYREFDGAYLFGLAARAEVPSDHPLLTRDELDQWRREMVASYRDDSPDSDVVRYIDRAYVLAFAEDCQELMHQTYRRVRHE